MELRFSCCCPHNVLPKVFILRNCREYIIDERRLLMANIEEKKTKAQNRENNTGIYRNHKDGVAYKLFSGKKESLSLYNCIMKTDYTNPDELEVVTLNSAIYIGRKNDNAIILHFNMLLTEFQTTFNPNMPLRTLIYVANEYEKYIAEHELNLYSEYIQEIPTPHFVTLYYGSKEQPEKQILKLSNAYKCKDESPELELMVTQYNVNPSYNEELKRRCPELDGYIKYVEKTRKYHRQGMTYEEAVKKSVDECIEEGILKEFFIKNKAEVISMTIFEYDEEEHMRLEREEQYRKGEACGEKRGIEIGEKKGRIFGAIGILKDLGMSESEIENQIRTKYKLNKDEIEKYFKEYTKQ